MSDDKKFKNYVLVFSVVLFLYSLTQKCYCTTSSCADSIMVLLLGWAAVFSSMAGIAWIANPLLFASWWLLKKKLKRSMILSIVSTTLSLSFLMFDNIIDNEAGHHNKIIGYKAGYWLWLCSSLSIALGTSVLLLKQKNRKPG